MTVNSRPEMANARTVTFQPISSESDLRYLAYVAGNRDRVTRLSDGRVGYIHLPNMGPEGIREFIKWYYPQIRRQGMVVDVRYNGGGNVSQMLIERLKRELLATGFGRTSDAPQPIPQRCSTATWCACSIRIQRPTATSSRRCSSRRSWAR